MRQVTITHFTVLPTDTIILVTVGLSVSLLKKHLFISPYKPSCSCKKDPI